MAGPDRQRFVASLYPIARAYAAQTGIPAEVFLGIAAHESNFGVAGSNMLFGIKGPGRSMATYEVEGGRDVPQSASFATYGSPQASFQGFVDLVSGGRYRGAWDHLQQTGDWRGFLRGLNNAGYATDPRWADKVASFTQSTIAPLVQALGPGTAEAAEIETGGGAAVEPRRPQTAPGMWRGTVAPTAPSVSAASRRIAVQLGEARTRLTTAQKKLAEATADTPTGAQTESEAADWDRKHQAAIKAAEDAADKAQARIDALETEAAAEEDRLAAQVAKPPPKPTATPRVKARDGSVWEQQPSGEWEQIEEIPTGAPTKAPTVTTPKASRTYKTGGATYTETAPDVGGFQPLPAGVQDPDAMTPYQASQLPIQQQNADTSRLSAAASMLHAQVAQGTLDFNSAIQVFNYVKAQGAPVEEGGKLYNAGFSPSNAVRQHFRLDPEPYAVQDLAGMLGRSDLNQHIRGPYPFGAGPMSPEEYQARQAGTLQGGPPQAAAPPPMGAQALPGRAGPPQPMLDPGGFSPQPALPPQPAPPQPSAPQFGGSPVGGEQGLMASLAKIRATLVQRGIDPAVAEQAARDFLKIPEPAGLGGAF